MKAIVEPRLAAALFALLILGFSACSTGTSKSSPPISPTRSEASATGPAAGPGLSPTRTDRTYAAELCRISLTFQTAVEKSLSGARSTEATSSSPSTAVPAITAALAEFTAGVERAAPPPDFEKFHGDLIAHLRDTLERLEADPTSAARSAAQNPFPTPPPELRERLAAAAATEPHCQAAKLTFR